VSLTVDEVVEAARSIGVGVSANVTRSLVRRSALVELVAPAGELATTPGESRFGGVPDLPAGEPWPEGVGGPLTFIGQIRLADVPPDLDGRDLLPEGGLLSFFYDVEEQPWGFSPEDRLASAVIWSDGAVSRRDAPTGTRQLPPWSARLRPVVSVPGWETWELERATGLSANDIGGPRGAEIDRWIEFGRFVDDRQAIGESVTWQPIHRVLGWPDQIQIDLHRENDTWAGDTHDPAACRRDWRLLLQVDTDDRLEVMWGDVGRIYWSIDAAEPMDDRFVHPPLILQCT
jgi:hypothetical protein